MSKCQIGHIPLRTFSGLRGLRSLDLSKNLIIHLDIRILKPLIFLRNLTLHGNPWVCDKLMQDLQAYTKIRQIALDDVCQKYIQPRKFEKMISIVQNQDKPDDINNYNDSYFWITDSPSRIECPDSNEETVTDPPDMLTTRLKKISPYWIFVSGLLIGSIISMVLTYTCASISRSILCTLPNIRRRHGRETHDEISQRVSLLENWQHGTDTPSCPGTPPPPYREVMLHSSLYPSASTATISRSNIANIRAQRF
ncbi:uncharacterized protein LOC107263221 [Cephus cinctus]|uniref:Uncharacterized protein LOC107263221 n=1 Tax=Cephus cinctus TaxID=211228 RepID=A0AAJ7BGY4_CEPCN|nr:uncharacterized protein LOC107263221 [Cephus cinctus]XP_024936050.1 uncharacterized protein LOC107263221 [Cephus cinctus]XP_024936082.1 uncharacterized protein LOC107263221 [Cephus cinctus]